MSETIKSIAQDILGEVSAAVRGVSEDEVNALVAMIADSSVIFTAASGRSGLVLGCAAMRLVHMGYQVHMTGEVTAPAIQKENLLLVVSGSGETEGIVTKARKARQSGARIGVITANSSSSLGELADMTLCICAPTPKVTQAGNARSCQPMGNLFEQTAFILLDAVIIKLMNDAGITSNDMFARHANLE